MAEYLKTEYNTPGTTTAATSDASTAVEQRRRVSARSFLSGNVDSNSSLLQLILFCFLTGFTSAPTFLACYLWCGFQTGGLVQLSLAVARLFATNDRTFHKPDQQALTSLLAFLLGSSIGRIGDKVGPKRRWWIMTATFIMALFTMAAALCAHFSYEPSVAEFRTNASWQNARGMAALAFASASLGLQGIVAKRLNTAFGVSLVLTTVWVELVNDPKLFVAKYVKSRDHRIFAVFFAFLGGLCSAGIVFASSSAVAFAACTGIRLVSVLSWLLVPLEKVK
ncbi:hypothetical protein RTBOTA2_005682 [Rhodotorula toruloides]|uniref:DUF1275 domain protein n=1 Tax=Rhodotorula toruloides TaxID=5286 RepID=A0A0K3CM78_RHOTO|nr:hypothetical protein RTBOTA2_005682 [Rhodotorula toruloides]PRQ72269.1 hypothetical protein AAT19DRAFT_9608 [Rhodotorula toruloides]